MKVAVWTPNLVEFSKTPKADDWQNRIKQLESCIGFAAVLAADVFVAPEWYFAKGAAKWREYIDNPKQFPDLEVAYESKQLFNLVTVIEKLSQANQKMLIVAGTMITKWPAFYTNDCVYGYGGKAYRQRKRDLTTGEKKLMVAPEADETKARQGDSHFAKITGPSGLTYIIHVCRDMVKSTEMGELDFSLVPAYALGAVTAPDDVVQVISDGADGVKITAPQVSSFQAVAYSAATEFNLLTIEDAHLEAIREMRKPKLSTVKPVEKSIGRWVPPSLRKKLEHKEKE